MKKVDLPVDEVAGLLRGGASYREVADRYGCSVGRVAGFAHDNGLAPIREEQVPAEAPRRSPGRPRPESAPNVVWNHIDRDLVEGEVVATAAGVVRRYKTYRELAEEHGVSLALIARYATEHRCMERRKERPSDSDDDLAPASPPAPSAGSRPSLAERKLALQHRLLDRIEQDLVDGKVATHVFSNVLHLLEQIADDSAETGSPEMWAANIVAQIAARQPILLEQRRIVLSSPALTGAVEPLVLTEERLTIQGPRAVD